MLIKRILQFLTRLIRTKTDISGVLRLGDTSYQLIPESGIELSDEILSVELRFDPKLNDPYAWIFDKNDPETGIRFSFEGNFVRNARIGFEKQFPDKEYNLFFWFDGFSFYEEEFKCLVSANQGKIEIRGELIVPTKEKSDNHPILLHASFEFDESIIDLTEYLFIGLNNTKNVNRKLVRKLLLTDCEVFPMEVLAFNQIEKLDIRSSSKSFRKIPEEIGKLSELTYLYLSIPALETVPDSLATLSKLEYLNIQGTRIPRIPDGISTLKSLHWLYLESNRLETLPENIGDFGIEIIYLRDNPFVSLPSSLQNIKEVDIEQDKKSLYMDTHYQSRNPDPINQEIYRLSSDQELFSKLNELIRKEESLQKYKQAILQLARKSLYFETVEEEDYAIKGNTRFGGMPDLPKNMDHPKSENGEYYTFHAQINLAEIAHLQDYMPRKGLLYFFVSDDEYIEHPLVFLTNNPPETLTLWEYDENTPFYNDVGDFTKGYKTTIKPGWSLPVESGNVCGKYSDQIFELSEDMYQIYSSNRQTDPYDKLQSWFCSQISCDNVHVINGFVFTQHESPEEQAVYKYNGEVDEWMNLLTLGWDKNTGYCFWDAGTLTYTIHKKDLAIADFSKVVATIESS